MTKQIKKPKISPEVGKNWLRRIEEEGESPPQIAVKDGFDIRTVRKQIEIARQDRESREARSVVLRNALESHYRDLCKYADSLTLGLSGERGAYVDAERLSTPAGVFLDSYVAAALREHLPRSPIWKGLDKLKQLDSRIGELEQDVRKRLSEEIGQDSRTSGIPVSARSQITEALAFQVKAWAQGWKGLSIKNDFKTKVIGSGLVSVQYGFAGMGDIEEKQAAQVSELLTEFESRITGWGQFAQMKDLLTLRRRLESSLRDELAIITHRRIVPGKCKYCPI